MTAAELVDLDRAEGEVLERVRAGLESLADDVGRGRVDSGAVRAQLARLSAALPSPSGGPRWRSCRALVPEIERFAAEPWVELRLGGAALSTLRPGQIALLNGGTGRGKTSLAASLLVEHAADVGPALAVSLELPADEWTARAIGLRVGASWPDVLRGKVSHDDMLAAVPERLAVIERRDATVDAVREAIVDLRALHPGAPILVAVDYVQLMPATSGDVRARVGEAMRQLDQLARDLRVVVVALSQTSRASAAQLNSGDAIGADTTDKGAETAELERWSTLTLAIGRDELRDDGSHIVELSTGKGRMVGGDLVRALAFDGRTGRWTVASEARSGDEVRAERRTARSRRDARDVEVLAMSVAQRLAGAKQPMSRRDLRRELGVKDTALREAVELLLGDRERGVVEVHPRRYGAFALWTRTHAASNKTAIVGEESQP